MSLIGMRTMGWLADSPSSTVLSDTCSGGSIAYQRWLWYQRLWYIRYFGDTRVKVV